MLAIWQRFSWFLAIAWPRLFYCACAETAISETLATSLTTSLDSATSYNSRIFDDRKTFTAFFALFFVHEQKRHYWRFASKSLVTRRRFQTFLWHWFLIDILKHLKYWRLHNALADFLVTFYCACAETAISELPTTILTIGFSDHD